jgi:hypothetical protein
MSRVYIYDNGGQLFITNIPSDTSVPKGMKLLWEGYADSPEEALAQYDPQGDWRHMGRA